MQVSATQLAATLGVSAARVSQYVSEGKLDGCYQGAGRNRRFDVAAVAAALNRRLDPAQALGNGAATKRTVRELGERAKAAPQVETAPPSPPAPSPASLTAEPDAYELARTEKAQEEARKLRRQNAEAEGTMVLASEVERQVARLMAREIAEMEAVLRDGARRIADTLGTDYRAARACLIEVWRAHRGGRTVALAAEAETARLAEAEQGADI